MPDKQPKPRAPVTAPRPASRTRAISPSENVRVAGRYRLENQIGEGGMGSVWAGWDEQLERKVAVKFMSAGAVENDILRGRFEREAKAAARLRTKHVVEVYEFGIDDGTPYIVMELLEGEDLRSRVKRMGRLPIDEVSKIVLHAAKALQTAEHAGIVHRDLKPANVFMARVDDEEVVKILDFGVAKRTGFDEKAPRTKSGVVLGSPPYMSPEQARGRPLDHRSDLWSLAAIAYRAITGRVPFSGDSDGDIIVKLCTESAPPPSSHVSGLDPGVDDFFTKAFARDVDERYQSALELGRAFADVAGVPAPRPTLSEIQEPADPEAINPRSPHPTEDALTTPMTGATEPLMLDAPGRSSPAETPDQSGERSSISRHPRRVGMYLALSVGAAVVVVAIAALYGGDAARVTSAESPATSQPGDAPAVGSSTATVARDEQEVPAAFPAPVPPRAAASERAETAAANTGGGDADDGTPVGEPHPRGRPRAGKQPKPGGPSWGY